MFFSPFSFNDTPTTEIYTLSLHDALPIYRDGTAAGFGVDRRGDVLDADDVVAQVHVTAGADEIGRAQSELQSHHDLVCRLLLEKKKNKNEKTTLAETQ